MLEEISKSIRPLDENAMRLAESRQDTLTKPIGSLGRLEDLSIRLAGMTANPVPQLTRKAVVVMAADHGVVKRGVALYPQDVTGQMVANFISGGAAINVLSRLTHARIVLCDMGVASRLPDDARIVRRRLGQGTADMSVGPAMSREQALASIEAGIDVVLSECDKGLDVVATGEMGIGNTTAASAIVSVMLGMPPESCVGRGAGLDDVALFRKTSVVKEALKVNAPEACDPIGVLSKVGGFEIGGLVGVILGAASRRVPVVLDGFISTSAALIAYGLNPMVREYLIAGHISAEIGHKPCLRHLQLEPLLDLGMRVGEGTGAALAFLVLDGAARLLEEMATFEEAGVSQAKT